MITILDYGLGNIKAFANVYERLKIETKIARTSHDLKDSKKIILPGVGSFDHAMKKLSASGMRDELEKQVIGNNIPILGVCLGMQILAKTSDEGKLPGLGWIDGNVNLFDASLIPYKTRLPHMGWNSIDYLKANPLFADLNEKAIFYFLHSYYFNCNQIDNSIAKSDYGISFTAAVNYNNIYGTQFHPEKSHSNGVLILKNFAIL